MNDLLLLSGTDIPFIQAEMNIRQPKIKDISYIGQQAFFNGCQFLNFSKNSLTEKDKNRLEKFKDFEVLMTIIKDENIAIKKNKIAMQLVLSLLFPDYKINFLPMSILFSKKNQNNEIERHMIDVNNFESFKKIFDKIFCLTQVFGGSTKDYNPGGPQAAALVEKFRERERKLMALKNKGKQKKGTSILAHCVSVLAIGQHKDINDLLQYTVYQLFDEYRRFKMKQNFDFYIQAKMAGAKDLEEIEDWKSDIHSR